MDKVTNFVQRRRTTGQSWLQKGIMLAGLCFVLLNAVDGYLTICAHQIAAQHGIQHSVEANPFLAPIASHWAISFKGILGLAAICLLGFIRDFSPRIMFRAILLGCIVFSGVIIFNMNSLGWLRW